MAQHDRDRRRLDAEAARASAMLTERNRARSASGRPSSGRSGVPNGRQPSKSSNQNGRGGAGSFVTRNLLYILCVVAVIAVATLVIVIVAPFSSDKGDAQNAEETYVSPYNWMNLDRTNGRYSYVVDGKVKSRLGVDVSENQRNVDWNAVANDGIDFAIIRLGYRGATEGDLYLDDYYQQHMEGARNAGLDCGVYFFSQAKTVEEAVEEAEFVIDNLNGVKLEYPVAFDSEEKVAGVSNPRTNNLDNETMSKVADAFCARIEQAGYKTMVYGNAEDLSRFKRSSLEGDHVWWAEYGASAPTAKIDIVMWQYSNSGKVVGISEAVDINLDLSNALS